MTIMTTTTDRKQMVREISEHLGIPAVYLRTPTYAFQIGKLTVNRDASISADDDSDLEAIKPFLIEKGYIESTEPEATEPETQEQSPEVPSIQKLTDEITQMDISIPHEGMSMNALRNFIFTIYSKQRLLNKVLESDLLFIHENVVTRLQEYLPEDIDGFVQLLEDFRGLGELSSIAFTDENITMSFPFNGQPTLDLALLDTCCISALVRTRSIDVRHDGMVSVSVATSASGSKAGISLTDCTITSGISTPSCCLSRILSRRRALII